MKKLIVFFDWLFLCILTILGGGAAFMTYRVVVAPLYSVFAATLLFFITIGCFYIAYQMYKDIRVLRKS